VNRKADLHIHTHYSDSTDSPQEVIRQAKEEQLICIAVTDHDTFEGVGPVQQQGKVFSIEVIPGVELSTEINQKEIHILGYFMELSDSPLAQELQKFQKARVERLKIMIERLRKEGIDNITVEEVCELTKSRAVGRPHLAHVLVKKGWVKSVPEAFAKYLKEGAVAYVKKYKISPREAIGLIHRSQGAAVLAHPMLINRDELIPQMVEEGLDGIEVYYPNCPESVTKYYEGLAQKHELILTGGSDAHGRRKEYTHVGKKTIDYERVELLKERIKRHRAK